MEVEAFGRRAPADLAAAVGLEFLSFFGILGDYSEIAHDSALGFGCEYFGRIGYQKGAEMKAESVQEQKAMASGVAAPNNVSVFRRKIRPAMAG